jgi:hypothetical protein
MKAFAGSSPPGAPLHPEAQFVSVDAVLRPEAAPRVSAPDEKFGWRNIATTCRGPNYDASGRLPPEKIQAVVRSAYGNFRKCYDHGLARSPTLRGRTAIRFVIERDGTTANPVIQDNTLPDCAVATCVRDSFAKLAYPAPEGGTITVTYPITLEPEP